MKLERIAYVVNVFPKLSETFIAAELSELQKRGIGLQVYSLRQPTETLRHGFIEGSGLNCLVHYVPEEFAALLREFDPQLIHAHFATEPAATARDWARALNVPFTFTAHGYDIRRKPPPDFAERAAAAAVLVTVSHANARYIADTFGIPLDRIRVIPCGVDTERFRPPDRKATDENFSVVGLNEVPLVVCVARHVAVKNLSRLLEAFALLRKRGAKFQAVLVGDGPLRGELEQQCSQFALTETVRFAGARVQEEVVHWWRRAAVAVLSSDAEGMPVSLMEAAACGVPAVAPAVGGITELIEDGVTGFLAAPGDVESLATALQRLLTQPLLAEQMGKAARRRAETFFSLQRQVDQLVSVWTEVLEGRNG